MPNTAKLALSTWQELVPSALSKPDRAFVRPKPIKELLARPQPEWVPPFITASHALIAVGPLRGLPGVLSGPMPVKASVTDIRQKEPPGPITSVVTGLTVGSGLPWKGPPSVAPLSGLAVWKTAILAKQVAIV